MIKYFLRIIDIVKYIHINYIRVLEKCNVGRIKPLNMIKKELDRDIFLYFCNLFIILVEWFAVFSVEESGNTNNFLLFVHDREGEDILNHPSSLIHRFFLSNESNRTSGSF